MKSTCRPLLMLGVCLASTASLGVALSTIPLHFFLTLRAPAQLLRFCIDSSTRKVIIMHLCDLLAPAARMLLYFAADSTRRIKRQKPPACREKLLVRAGCPRR